MEKFNGGLFRGLVIAFPFAVITWISLFGWFELIISWFK